MAAASFQAFPMYPYTKSYHLKQGPKGRGGKGVPLRDLSRSRLLQNLKFVVYFILTFTQIWGSVSYLSVFTLTYEWFLLPFVKFVRQASHAILGLYTLCGIHVCSLRSSGILFPSQTMFSFRAIQLLLNKDLLNIYYVLDTLTRVRIPPWTTYVWVLPSWELQFREREWEIKRKLKDIVMFAKIRRETQGAKGNVENDT